MSTMLPLGRAEIEAILPHRDPFLLLDEVIELVPGTRVVARKTVTEEDCAGHFPGNPIMPGVKMVEALAQAGAVAVLSEEENRGKLALFAGIDDVRFKRVVRPGDVLELTCDLEAMRGPIGRGRLSRPSAPSSVTESGFMPLGRLVRRGLVGLPLSSVPASPACRALPSSPSAAPRSSWPPRGWPRRTGPTAGSTWRRRSGRERPATAFRSSRRRMATPTAPLPPTTKC